MPETAREQHTQDKMVEAREDFERLIERLAETELLLAELVAVVEYDSEFDTPLNGIVSAASAYFEKYKDATISVEYWNVKEFPS